MVSQRSTSRKFSGALVVELFDESVAFELVEAFGIEASGTLDASREVEASRSGDGLAVELDDESVTVERCGESLEEEVLDAFALASVAGICPVVAALESIEGDGWSIAIVVPPIATKVMKLATITPGFLINDRRDSSSMMSCVPRENVPVVLHKNLQDKP